MTNKGWKALNSQNGGAHFMQIWCQKDLQTLYRKDDRPVNSHNVNHLETIWIIVDDTTYKDLAPTKH